MGVTIRCSLFLWTAAFSSPFHLNVVPAPFFSAALSRLLPKERSSQNHIPFRRSFSCQSAKQKADTQRHQKSAGALLSLQNDVLCIGFEIQRRDCLFIHSLADSTKKHKVRTAVFSFSTPQALGGVRLSQSKHLVFSCSPLLRGIILYQKTRRKSSFSSGF